MKRATLLAWIFSCAALPIFADNIVIDNQTTYPKAQGSKMAIQWAKTAKDVDQENAALVQGKQPAAETLQPFTQSGKATVDIPKDAEYFRVLIWSKSQSEPDLHTNWVDVVPKKTYSLKQNQLVPTVLMSGMGC